MSKLTGLISCQALLEGFDAPPATVCLWARPTKSGLLYTQGTGRVLRPFPAPVQAVPGDRPYQTECLQEIRQASIAGCNRQLVVLPTGGGKTHIFSQMPRVLNLRRPDQMLVLVQADELAFQAMDKVQRANPGMKVGLEKAQYKSSWSDDIIVASVQTLGGTKAGDTPGTWEWSKRLKSLDPSRIVKVVVDECFPAGTDISGVPIEAIKQNDQTLSFNHALNRFEIKKVVRKFRRRPAGMVRVRFSNGESLCCTPEHPFFTKTSGYLAAKDCAGSYVMHSTMLHFKHGRSQLLRVPNYHSEAHQIPNEHLLSCQKDVLLEILQQPISVTSVIRNNGTHESSVCIRENDIPQSDEVRISQGKGSHDASRNGVEASCARGEWQGAECGAVTAGFDAGMGNGSGNTDKEGSSIWIPAVLQGRHSEPDSEDIHRSGRPISSITDGAGLGRKENSFFNIIRVDCVEVLEQTSDGTFGGVCPDGFVYNIEVEGNNNYFASDYLVHNCHHITANNYHGILRYLGVMKSDPAYNDPAKFLLGVTATPNRSDNKGLEGFFEKIVYSRDIRTMIREGWLSNPVGHRVDTMVSLDGVGSRGGDYIDGQLSKTVNTPERNSLIVDKYLELGDGAPFIGLTVDVQHTIDLTNMFRFRGIETFGIASRSDESCEWLVSKENDRRTVIDKFNADWQGYTKKNAIIIDFVDNTTTVGAALVTAPSLFGLRPDFNLGGQKAIDVVEEVEKIKAAKPGINAALFTDLNALRAMSEKIDLFAVPTVPPEVQQASQFSWTTGISEGTYQLSLPDRGMLSIKVTALGEFEIAKHVTGVKTPLGAATTLAEALKMADKHIPQEAQVMLRSDAQWRSLPASEAQLGLLKRLYPELRRPFTTDQDFYTMVGATYSRGQVSSMISQRSDRIPRRR